MRSLNTLLACLALAIPASGQALSESFNYSSTGLFPPAGWSKAALPGSVTSGWMEPSVQALSVTVLTSNAAGHDDYSSGQFSDNVLDSPSFDLSAYGTPELTFDDDLGYAGWLLVNGNITAAGVSTVEVSTDGGSTWTIEWSEAAALSGFYPGINVDLSSYAGQSNVKLRFHYVGTYAHAWGVDNVVVDNGGNPVGPSLSVSAGAPGGAMTFDFGGFTPSSTIAVVYGPAGTYVVPGGSCAGLTVNLLPVNFPPLSALITLAADGSGNAQLTQNIPGGAAGLTVQAADVATCTASNSIIL